MTEDERWQKVREIVREENERAIDRILAAIGKSKKKIELVNGRWLGIGEDEMAAWGAAYPAVDIQAELNKAAAWIISNPSLAPRSQFGRFIGTWLTRSQNQASLRSIPSERKTEVKLKLCAYCDRTASGQVGGIWACDPHWDKAMNRDPIPHMRGVEAKPVAGS